MSPKADSIFRSRQQDGRNVGTTFGLFTLSVDQTFDLTAPNHIEFDTELQVSADMVGAISAGTGQNLGKITLPAGKIYEVTGGFSYEAGASSDQLCCSIFDLLENAAKGLGGFAKTLNAAESRNDMPIAQAFIDTRDRAGIVQVEFRILSGAGLQRLNAGTVSTEGGCFLKVKSL